MIDEVQPRTIVLVEDDAALRHATVQGLELAGFIVHSHADAESALSMIGQAMDGVLLSDVRLPRMDGLQLLAAVNRIDADIPVVLITGHGDVPMAVSALKQGAFDFLTKPFAIDHLSAVLDRALERRALLTENRSLRAAVDLAEAEGPLIGSSRAMTRVRAQLRKLAAADMSTLIEGESGTGKTLVATLLHRLGPRRARPLIAIDLATTPPEQVDFDLFGHAPDSVPHTRLSRTGALTLASGGTLLLENVGHASQELQARVLHALEDQEVLPIGADRAEAVNLRIVATRTLAKGAPEMGAALGHHLAPGRIVLPPVRDREQDLLLLYASFFEEAGRELGVPALTVPPGSRDRLYAYDWPDNLRELRRYAFEVATGAAELRASCESDEPALRERVAAFERMAIVSALKRTGGNVTAALRILKLPRKTLYEKFVRYGIKPQESRRSRH